MHATLRSVVAFFLFLNLLFHFGHFHFPSKYFYGNFTFVKVFEMILYFFFLSVALSLVSEWVCVCVLILIFGQRGNYWYDSNFAGWCAPNSLEHEKETQNCQIKIKRHHSELYLCRNFEMTFFGFYESNMCQWDANWPMSIFITCSNENLYRLANCWSAIHHRQ